MTLLYQYKDTDNLEGMQQKPGRIVKMSPLDGCGVDGMKYIGCDTARCHTQLLKINRRILVGFT